MRIGNNTQFISSRRQRLWLLVLPTIARLWRMHDKLHNAQVARGHAVLCGPQGHCDTDSVRHQSMRAAATI